MLGPADGRYVLRGPGDEDASHILVLRTLGAPERRRLGRRRSRPAEPEPDPAPVSTARATVIAADRLADEETATGWLEAARRQPDEEVDAALAQLNRALRAHRIAAGDPFIREAAREEALVIRLGWGRGEQVADGRWSEAVDLPRPPRPRLRREAALRPQERLAALLGGREEPLACEELVLRARADLEAGRPREAALQVRVALEAALAALEADRDRHDMAERLEELAGLRPQVGAAANAALAGSLDPEAAAGVSRAVERLEAALRARTASR